jgi:YidC/Oxa1 family membrane protein insertase
MGWIIDFVFNFVYQFTEKNSLGISIILLTIIIRFLMLPLAFKSQKSMMAMQKLTPEIDKIRKKYGDSKDVEIQKKMNAEMQALYTKNKVSPFGGCLPLLIQMPIFFALTYLMNQSFLYIAKLRGVYEGLATQISGLLDKIPPIGDYQQWVKLFIHVGMPHVPSNMQPFQFIPTSQVPEQFAAGAIQGFGEEAARSNLIKIINRLTETDWAAVFNGVAGIPGVNELATPEQLTAITALYQQKNNIEMFFGLNMLNNAGWLFPGIVIPILTVLTTVLSSWLSTKMTSQANKDGNAAMQQKVMMIIMPLMMGFFTVTAPVGVGIYWITSSVFQVIQQWIMNRRYAVSAAAQKDKPTGR